MRREEDGIHRLRIFAEGAQERRVFHTAAIENGVAEISMGEGCLLPRDSILVLRTTEDAAVLEGLARSVRLVLEEQRTASIVAKPPTDPRYAQEATPS